MPIIQRLCILYGVLTATLALCASAQQTIQSGTVRVAFPSKDWTRTALPEPAVGGQDSSKPILFAEGFQQKLQLHVTRFDYPAAVNEQNLAVFVERLQRQYRANAFGRVKEDHGDWNGIPTIELEAQYRGWNFVRARLAFCDKGVYLIETGGAGELQGEATRCAEGVALSGESPLDKGLFSRMLDVRERARENTKKLISERAQARAGWALEIQLAGIALTVLFLLAAGVHIARRVKMGELRYLAWKQTLKDQGKPWYFLWLWPGAGAND